MSERVRRYIANADYADWRPGARNAPSPSWSTPTSRTSRGLRRGATGDWAYVAHNGLADPRLFHLADDPLETRNLAREHGEVVAELADLVEQSTGGSLPVYAG